MRRSRDNVPIAGADVERERLVKAADPTGAHGTTARYWINQHLGDLAREHFGSGPRRILDLGCGDGPNLGLLAAVGLSGRYTGVDLAASPYWPDREGRRGSLDVRFRTHDAHRIGSLDEDFDALVSVSAFEHFRDDEAVIQGLSRRMVPGARGIVIVPSPYGNLVWGFNHGYRTYTPDRFRKILGSGPLRLVHSVASGSLPSLCMNSAWRGASLAASYAVMGAVWARYGFDRSAAKRGSPWISTVAGDIQFGHLKTKTGRTIHSALNRGLHELDERLPGMPTQWVFIVERT